MSAINRALDLLVRCWEYDVAVFSQWWIYLCLGIPAAVYLAFFFLKWAVLTTPVWLPIVIIAQACKSDANGKHLDEPQPESESER